MISRREFLASLPALAAMASCAPAPRAITGRIVGASRSVGHRLREGGLPVPREVRDVPVVIAGGGIAGLSAAWKLSKCGVRDFELLELEGDVGGHSRGGGNAVTPYPWGAHYVPVPTAPSRAVRELFEELGVIEGWRSGEPVYQERHLCAAPQERLFIHGRWIDGLFPRSGMTAAESDEVERFLGIARAYRERRVFAIPLERSSRDAEILALDAISMREWLDRHGFASPRLRWWLDYCCRDDYGCAVGTTSAWAAFHYLCARELDDPEVLTWPEGNAWLVKRLAERCAGAITRNTLVYRVEPSGDGAAVDALVGGTAVRYRARHVIYALPRFTAPYVVAGARPVAGLTYAPWMVANLTLERLPDEASWDNVIFDSPSLGYVVATHQTPRARSGPSVITYYQPLTGDPAAERQAMLLRPWEEWRDDILRDLRRAHRDIDGLVTNIDVMLWGHAMARPVPGFVWGAARREAARPLGPIRFAHSDLSGLSIFEEAQYWGVLAAEQVMAAMGHSFETSL
jgi:glycine/D-amino acid oxidase-like deaminating enzyme